MEAPNFWDDPVVSQKKMKELKSMKDDVATYASLKTEFEDIETLIEMGYEENDASLIPEIQEMLDEFTKTYEGIRIKTLLSGEYDSDGAIVSLHAGAGGTESCDWAAMLYRMYTRWASDKGFSVEVLDSLDGEEAGIKSITFQINGENAYGYMKSEKGVHRLVRISPFNAAGKRQTSFVSCDVMPDIVTLRSMRTICGSIPTVQVVPVDSISIRHLPQSVLRIFRPESWYSARMSVPSSRTRIRQCRC